MRIVMLCKPWLIKAWNGCCLRRGVPYHWQGNHYLFFFPHIGFLHEDMPDMVEKHLVEHLLSLVHYYFEILNFEPPQKAAFSKLNLCFALCAGTY